VVAVAILSLNVAFAEGSAQATAPAPLRYQDLIVVGDVINISGDESLHASLRQALYVALDESPWLNTMSQVGFAAALKKMGRSPDIEITDDLSRAVCQQIHGAGYVTGLIERNQSGEFAITLRLIYCDGTQTVSTEQHTGLKKENIIDALGQAVGSLREKAGEPHDSVRKFSTPLSQATSSSIAALDAWSTGLKNLREKGAIAAIPSLQNAIKADPRFASAIYNLGICYRNAGQEGRARDYIKQAFALRDRAGVRTRLAIAGSYYSFVTVDSDKAVSTYTELIQTYPSDEKARNNLGSFYGDVCRYEEAIAQFKEASRLDPGDVIAQENQVELLPAVGRFDEARQVFAKMLANGLDDDTPHVNMYAIAFHQNDAAEMARQVAWFDAKPELRHEILSEQADAAAYAGQLKQARELTKRAIDSAIAADNKEQAAIWLLNSAWREQLFGNSQIAHDEAMRALDVAPESREGGAMAAIILARTGDIGRSNSITSDLQKRYPDHSVVQSYWLPCIRAQIALARNDTASALRELNIAAPLDLLYPQVMFYSHMPSVLLRAEAYARMGDQTSALNELTKIIDNPGIVQLSATAPVAKLQLARAYAAQAKAGDRADITKARNAYREFLSLWKDADGNSIPLLREARTEKKKFSS
jgi:eukaryotic-like serine/threonine-protein kinase